MSFHAFFASLFFVMSIASACLWGQSEGGVAEKRNLVQKYFPSELVAVHLVSRADFHPFPKDAAEWSSRLSEAVLGRLVAQGEAALHYEFPSIPGVVGLDYHRTGDRRRHADLSYTKRQMLLDLVLAESVERKGRFVDAIFNGVWSICEESFWGVPAHVRGTVLPDVEHPQVDLFAAETAVVLALTDYFVGDELDDVNPMIRKRISREINHRIFDPMMNDSAGYFYLRTDGPVNNWNPWIMSNWLWCILLIEDDDVKRLEMTNQAIENIDLYVNGLGPDGGCDEGPSYWFAAGACVFDYLETLEMATNVTSEIYQEPLLRGMLTFFMKAHIAGRYVVNFSDASPKASPDGCLLYRIGDRMGDPNMMAFGTWAAKQAGECPLPSGFERGRKLGNLFTYPVAIQNHEVYEPPKSVWIEDVQFFAARTSRGIFAALRGGHNGESHNHNDIGDVLVYCDGEPFIVDVGSGTYTSRTFSSRRYTLWYTRGDHHNVPLIRGTIQREGSQYRSRVVDVDTDSAEVHATLDLASAYPSAAGVQRWERSLSISRDTNEVELIDKFELAANEEPLSETPIVQQVFMTPCEIAEAVPGSMTLISPSGKSLSILYDPDSWTWSSDEPSCEGADYGSIKEKWDGATIRRIVFSKTGRDLVGSHQFKFVLKK